MPTIDIRVERGEVVASVSGSTTFCINDLKRLGLDNDDLKTAFYKLRSSRAGDFEFCMYCQYSLTYGADNDDIEVEEHSEILGVNDDIVRNPSRDLPYSYTSSLTHEVTHSVELTWSSTHQKTIGYKVEGGVQLKGSAGIDFTTTTGKSVSKKRSETIRSERRMSFDLRPGQKKRAVLSVSKRHITVKIPFTFEATGYVAISHTKGSPEVFDLKDVLRAVGKRSKHTTTATINLTCFTDADVALYDY